MRKTVLVILGIYAFALGLGFGILYAGSRYRCHQTGVALGMESKYVLGAGCFIEYKGTAVPTDDIKTTITLVKS
jgi:hypothetical protein